MPRLNLLLFAATLVGATPVLAQESSARADESTQPTSAKSEEELAKEAQNPVADIYSFPFQDNIGLNYGPAKGVQNVLNFQPVIPIHAGPVNIITRTIIPLITNPYASPEQSGATGLGDISFSAFISPAHPGALIWGVGPALSFPTATSPQVGSQSTWGLGPSVVLLTMPGHWVIGFVTNVVFSIAGDPGSSFYLQPFVNYNFGGGWYFTTAPTITAAWNLPPQTGVTSAQWTVPIGGGFGKLQRFGKLPINFNAQVFWDAVRPSVLPSAPWTFRLQVTVLL
jgi:hypothetical protein